MPVDKKRYPVEWKEIVQRRHEEAGEQCEWVEWVNGEWIRCSRMHHEPIPGNEDKRTILTLAHLGAPQPGAYGDPHDKLDVRPENLLLLCQRHHLLYDLAEHMKKAKETRLRKKVKASGQQRLF